MKRQLQQDIQLQKEFWKVGNTIFWSLNAVILFSIIIDVVILSKDWFDFVILKIFLLAFFFIIYKFFRRKGSTPNFLVHLILFSFNFLALISISYSDLENRVIYTSLLISLFVAFNTIAIWSIIHSFIQYILVIITFTALVYTGIITDPSQILKEGGYLFLVLGFFSFFFPKIRKKALIERIAIGLRADEKIKYLGSELSETQKHYQILQSKVSKKENESKFLFQQISNDLNKINQALSQIEDNCPKEKKKELNDLVQNLRNQSSVYFKPTNLTAITTSYTNNCIDIKQIYLDIFNSFTTKIKQKNITGIDYLTATNTNIAGNERMFKTIIYNILDFMVTFSKEHDEIEVHIENKKDDVVFSVSNKTQGINTIEIESYFRDMEFVNYDYKKHSNSLKIGLRISKQLTEKMNGYFSYVSSEKMGFELKLQFTTYKAN